jgi:hypothetical protein
VRGNAAGCLNTPAGQGGIKEMRQFGQIVHNRWYGRQRFKWPSASVCTTHVGIGRFRLWRGRLGCTCTRYARTTTDCRDEQVLNRTSQTFAPPSRVRFFACSRGFADRRTRHLRVSQMSRKANPSQLRVSQLANRLSWPPANRHSDLLRLGSGKSKPRLSLRRVDWRPPPDSLDVS